MPSAEVAYLFRHAVLRDAAYQLQLPGDRARLHELALELIEILCSGSPPCPEFPALHWEPHPTDEFTTELAEHAQKALASKSPQHGLLASKRRLYLLRGALSADRRYLAGEAMTLWEELAEISPIDEEAECRSRAAVALQELGMSARADAAYARALEVMSANGNELGKARTLRGFGTLCQQQGRNEDAEAAFRQAIQTSAKIDDVDGRLHGLRVLAMLLHQRGDIETAETVILESLEIARSTDNKGAEGVVLASYAVLLERTGRTGQSEETALQALAIHREVGNLQGEAGVLTNLGTLMNNTGRFDEALDHMRQALITNRSYGGIRMACINLGNIAGVLQEKREFDAAERNYKQAIDQLLESGNPRLAALYTGDLGGLYVRTGRASEGAELYERALEVHRRLSTRRGEGVHLCGYASCRLALGETERARELWRAGREILEQLRDTVILQHLTVEMRKACTKANVEPFE